MECSFFECLQLVENGAGDRIRTGDVQLGKLGNTLILNNIDWQAADSGRFKCNTVYGKFGSGR